MSNLVFDESSSNREASHGYAWWFSGDTSRRPWRKTASHASAASRADSSTIQAV